MCETWDEVHRSNNVLRVHETECKLRFFGKVAEADTVEATCGESARGGTVEIEPANPQKLQFLSRGYLSTTV